MREDVLLDLLPAAVGMERKTARKLIWLDEKSFKGWGCNACGWVLSNPRFAEPETLYRQQVQGAFNNHDCEKSPSKKQREEFQPSRRANRPRGY